MIFLAKGEALVTEFNFGFAEIIRDLDSSRS